MSAVFITYDLNSPGQSYEQVIKAIKAVTGNWCKVAESSWLVGGYTSASGVFEAVKPFIDKGDRVLSIDVSGKPRQGWLTQGQWNWINQYI